MSESTDNQNITKNIDPALLGAWSDLLYFDSMSISERANFKRLRRWVIIISFTVTFTSVASLMFELIDPFAIGIGAILFLTFILLQLPTKDKKRLFDKTIDKSTKTHFQEQFQLKIALKNIHPALFYRVFLSLLIGIGLGLIMHFTPSQLNGASAILVLALPIIGLNMMNYTSLYSKPTTWIEHRYAAEKIRSEIYLYRSCAGEYAKKTENLRNNLLNENIATVLREAPYGVPPTHQNLLDNGAFEVNPQKEILSTLTYSEGDDGFKLLSDELGLEQYIKTRIDGQVRWYQEKIEQDYEEGKRSSRYAIIITALGSMGGLIFGASEPRWVGLFAISNAVSVALYAWSNVSMVGKTYGIYYKTWQELRIQKREWKSSLDDDDMSDPNKKEQARITFINKVEQTLMGELTTWFNIATEIQLTNDTSMRNNISKPTDTEK